MGLKVDVAAVASVLVTVAVGYQDHAALNGNFQSTEKFVSASKSFMVPFPRPLISMDMSLSLTTPSVSFKSIGLYFLDVSHMNPSIVVL